MMVSNGGFVSGFFMVNVVCFWGVCVFLGLVVLWSPSRCSR